MKFPNGKAVRISLLLIVFPLLAFCLAMPAAYAQSPPGPRPAQASTPLPNRQATWSITGTRDIQVEGRPLVLSPDGEWIAGLGRDEEFCVWNVATFAPACDGDHLRIQIETIIWAPDSSAVAFSLDAARLLIDSDVYVFDIDRGKLHNLTDDGVDDKLPMPGSTGAGGQNSPVNIDMYPAWAADSSSLILARSVWPSGTNVASTSIVSVPRTGGAVTTIEGLATEPFVVYAPMHWLEDGTILFSIWHSDPRDTQNGLFRIDRSGDLTMVMAGDVDAEIPLPAVISVSPDGTTATVLSEYRREQQVPGEGEPVYFSFDLASGKATPLALPGDVSHGGFVASPGRFSFNPGESISIIRDLHGPGEYQLAIATSMSADLTILPLDTIPGSYVFFHGVDWSAKNTLFLPAAGNTGGVILSLTRADMLTCGCTAPSQD